MVAERILTDTFRMERSLEEQKQMSLFCGARLDRAVSFILDAYRNRKNRINNNYYTFNKVL